MLNRRQTTLSLLSLGLPPLLAAPGAHAQASFPSRPVSVMVAQPAGTPSDNIARKMQPVMQQALGQSVVIENLGGAGGTIGTARMLAQPADGHSLIVATPTEIILSPLTIPGVTYKPEDFILLGQFGKIPYVLCARPTLAASTLTEVLALKGKGAPLTMANIGQGSLTHLVSLEFAKRSTLEVTHVPFRGIAPIVTDVMGGQLDLAFLPLAGNVPTLMAEGKLKAIGLSTDTPSALFPKIPTLASQHSSFATFDFDVWGGVLVRRDTPPAVVQRLYQVVSQTLADPGFVAYMRSTGSNPVVLPFAELQAFYPREVARSTALLKAYPDALK
jgi:tripartite-type tricarboxylate transporter receptor subunit TctC